MYPGLTAEELLAPQPLPFAEPGRWNYHRLTPEGQPGGFVALPGSDLVLARPNTVAVVCSSTSLGVGIADGQEHECIALIDRSDEAVSARNACWCHLQADLEEYRSQSALPNLNARALRARHKFGAPFTGRRPG